MKPNQAEPGKARDITIVTSNGQHGSVHAAYVNEHFAVHETAVDQPRPDGTWTVTHIPTGRSLTTFCESAEQARTVADWIKENFESHGVDASESNVLTIRTSMSNRGLLSAIAPRLARIRDAYLLSIANEADS